MFYGTSFRVFRSRHPLARLATGVLGVVAVLLLVTVGMFALAALAIGGGLFLLVNALRQGGRPMAGTSRPADSAAHAPGVIEGEYTVVRATSSRRTGAH